MLARLFGLVNSCLTAIGCLLTSAAVGLVLFAIFGLTTPAAREGRGIVILLAMVAALFGLPFLLSGRGGKRKGADE